jgi:hypothetical protein
MDVDCTCYRVAHFKMLTRSLQSIRLLLCMGLIVLGHWMHGLEVAFR